MPAYTVPQFPSDTIDQAYAGDDWSFTFRVGEQEGTDPIEYTDLSGWTITAQFRTSRKATTAHDLIIDMVDAADGYITVAADEILTRAMVTPGQEQGVVMFDVQGKFGTLDETFGWGLISWQLDITRSS